jgi:hypothetical protein
MSGASKRTRRGFRDARTITDAELIENVGTAGDVYRLLNDLRDFSTYRGQAASAEAKIAGESAGLVSVVYHSIDPTLDVVELSHRGRRIAQKIAGQ